MPLTGMHPKGTQRKRARQKPAKSKAKLAFILSLFPCIDETFILREMSVLAAHGFEFDVFSLKKPVQKAVHQQAEALASRAVYRNYLFSWEVLQAQIHFILCSGTRYFAVLGVLIRETWRRPVILAKCLAAFPKAVCYGRLVQQHGVRHIHAFWATFPCTVAWIIHRLTGIPFSFSAHAHDIYEDDTMLERKLRAASFVMTCTAHNLEHLSALAPEKKDAIHLIYHGLDLEPFGEDAQHKDECNGIFRILSIGTLYKTKGFDTLIEACAWLKQSGIAFQCQIVGDGPERENLERLIAQRELQAQVKMLGYLTQLQLRPLRRWADVFILLPRPYLHWGLPNVFIESLAAQTPVIATPLNAIGELVKDDQTGVVVACDDPEAAAKALSELCHDPARRKRLALEGYKKVHELFDVHRTSSQVARLFSKIT